MKKPSDYFNETVTDKISIHSYYIYDLFIYYLYLINQQPINVLEVGVSIFANDQCAKGSGHAFCEMPYVEKFVGIDILDLDVPFSDGGIFIKSDAYCETTIKKLNEFEPFHLIIDDGSHSTECIKFFFEHYEQFCATPSIMVAEDIHESAMENTINSIGDPDIYSIHASKANEDDMRNDSNLLVKMKL